MVKGTGNENQPRFPRASRRGYLVTFFLLALSLLAVSTFWSSRDSLVNFVDPTGPRYTGAYGPPDPDFDGQLKLVSWNIRFGEKTDVAITELGSIEVLQDADVLLLQEMDETGVEQIAQALRYNYVYYPASIHRHGLSFGNAVLSRWPIGETVKIILPHASPANQQRRIAVGAVLAVGDSEVTAYSVHTETPALSGAKREEQVAHLAQEIALEGRECVVAGGDFNTITPTSVSALTERMEASGLFPVTENPQPTTRKGFVGFTLDHLFVRGLAPEAAGVWTETAASDHFPIWALVSACDLE